MYLADNQQNRTNSRERIENKSYQSSILLIINGVLSCVDRLFDLKNDNILFLLLNFALVIKHHL